MSNVTLEELDAITRQLRKVSERFEGLAGATPVAIPLADAERCMKFLGYTPDTITRWHNEDGCPVRWRGHGKGRRGHVVVEEFKRWWKRQEQR